MILYFISSSSIPRPTTSTGEEKEGFTWKGSTEGPSAEEVGGEKSGELNGQMPNTAVSTSFPKRFYWTPIKTISRRENECYLCDFGKEF